MAISTAKFKRRGNGEGTIYQMPNGTWRGQCKVGYNADGKPHRVSVTGKTRAEAAQKLAAIIASNTSGKQLAHHENLTLAAYGAFWLTDEKRLEVGERTYAWYKNLLEAHISPALGNYPLDKLSTQTIQQFLNEQVRKGYSTRQLTGLRTTLCQIFRLACQNNLMRDNPAEQTKINRPKAQILAQQRKQKAFTIHEREQLINALQEEYVMRPLLLTLLFTGMRIGELLALQWKHIDFDNRLICIEQALSLNPAVDKKGNVGKYMTSVSEPKTVSSYRKIPIPQTVYDELLTWQHNIEALFSLEHSPDTFVFCNTQTGQMRTYDGFRASYKKFLKRHQLNGPIWHLHTYRHTCATMLLESGVNPKLVQYQLGHASISTTLNIYSHVGNELVRETGNALEYIYQQMQQGTYQPKVI